jgi:hypothetical protein
MEQPDSNQKSRDKAGRKYRDELILRSDVDPAFYVAGVLADRRDEMYSRYKADCEKALDLKITDRKIRQLQDETGISKYSVGEGSIAVIFETIGDNYIAYTGFKSVLKGLVRIPKSSVVAVEFAK